MNNIHDGLLFKKEKTLPFNVYYAIDLFLNVEVLLCASIKIQIDQLKDPNKFA
jgi:hypothetical protein